MALPGIPWLLLVLIVAVTPAPCTSEERARMAGSLLHCYLAPALANTTNGTTFRASLLPLLVALPSAAAPTGCASLRSDRAFVRGLCFGDATVPSECLGCLSAAATNITAGCGVTTRRAGMWSAGCFLAYADTDASSPSEDDFRELIFLSRTLPGDHADTALFYSATLHHKLVAIAQAVAQSAVAEISGARMLATADATTVTSVARDNNSSYYVHSKVWVVAQCARRDGGAAAADCVRCLQDSARAVDWDVDAARGGGLVAAVVGFNCHLRFEVSTSVWSPDDIPMLVVKFLVIVLLVIL